MAAPQKPGLDYFPLDVGVENNKKVFYLESQFGPAAFTVVIKLWCRIYQRGYYLKWTEREAVVFARQTGIDLELVNSIVSECLEECLFSPAIYSEHGILTSAQIQQRYLYAVSRRKRVEMIKQLTLISLEGFSNVVNVDINPSKCEQKPPKEKNSIEEDSKEEQEDGPEPGPDSGPATDSEPVDQVITKIELLDEVIMKIELIPRDGIFEVRESYYQELRESFPGLNIMQVLRTVRQWSRDNSNRRKTAAGIKKHISSWCARDQNAGRNLLKTGELKSPQPGGKRKQEFPKNVTCNFCTTEFIMHGEKEACPNPDCEERYYSIRPEDGMRKKRFPEEAPADSQLGEAVEDIAAKMGGE